MTGSISAAQGRPATTMRSRGLPWRRFGTCQGIFDEIDNSALMHTVHQGNKDKQIPRLMKAFFKSGTLSWTERTERQSSVLLIRICGPTVVGKPGPQLCVRHLMAEQFLGCPFERYANVTGLHYKTEDEAPETNHPLVY